MMNPRMNCIALSLTLTLLTRSPLFMVVLQLEGHPWMPWRCQGIEPKGFCQSRNSLFYYTPDGLSGNLHWLPKGVWIVLDTIQMAADYC